MPISFQMWHLSPWQCCRWLYVCRAGKPHLSALSSQTPSSVACAYSQGFHYQADLPQSCKAPLCRKRNAEGARVSPEPSEGPGGALHPGGFPALITGLSKHFTGKPWRAIVIYPGPSAELTLHKSQLIQWLIE